MKRTDTIIVGGGQAGLAMSRCLADLGVDNVVLERGQVGERWRSERWDSLRMLTPRWQSRLPGWSYDGPERAGYMTKSEVIDYLSAYAQSFSAPVVTGASVESVQRDVEGFRVRTTAGVWCAPSVVLATGHCDRPKVPAMAKDVSKSIEQITPTMYRNTSQLRDAGVLVVGASASGIQLAAEIAESGRPVTMAVGRHTRLPRWYRGNDIMAWFDAMGVLTESVEDVRDLVASRAQPSLQLVGSDDHRALDLDTMQQRGVRLVGRMLGARNDDLHFANDLAQSVHRAERKMNQQLDRVDELIEIVGQTAEFPVEPRPRPVAVPKAPSMLSLASEGIGTILWATGYRRRYPWLHVSVLDAEGELRHDGGVTPEPGLYAIGLNFMRRRNSAFIDGVGLDAAELADHIVGHLSRRAGNAA